MNVLEIEYKARVLVWRSIIQESSSTRTHLKQQLLSSLNPAEGISWKEAYSTFNTMRQELLSPHHQQGWFWDRHFIGLKQWISTHISATLGNWLSSLFQGSDLRQCLVKEHDDLILELQATLKENVCLIQEDFKHLMKDCSAQLTDAAIDLKLRHLESTKTTLGFSDYVKNLGYFAKKYPQQFIHFYQSKLHTYVGNDLFAHVIHHCFAQSVLILLMPQTKEIHPHFHTAAEILLVLNQPGETPSTSSAWLTNPKHFHNLYGELSERLEQNITQYQYHSHSSIDDDHHGTLLPIHLLSLSPKLKNNIIAQCLGKELIYQLVITGMLSSQCKQIMGPRGFGYKTIHEIAAHCGLLNSRDAIHSPSSNGFSSLLFLEQPFKSFDTTSPALAHVDNIFFAIVHDWFLLYEDTECIATRFLENLTALHRELREEENVWLLHRLDEFQQQLLRPNTTTQPNRESINKTFEVLRNILLHPLKPGPSLETQLTNVPASFYGKARPSPSANDCNVHLKEKCSSQNLH